MDSHIRRLICISPPVTLGTRVEGTHNGDLSLNQPSFRVKNNQKYRVRGSYIVSRSSFELLTNDLLYSSQKSLNICQRRKQWLKRKLWNRQITENEILIKKVGVLEKEGDRPYLIIRGIKLHIRIYQIQIIDIYGKLECLYQFNTVCGIYICHFFLNHEISPVIVNSKQINI